MSAINKARATNAWAVSQFRYFFGSFKWSNRELRKLDKTTKRVMRQFRCHQYGSSVERVHLPRSEGGRGVSSLEHVYEREVLSTTAYLCGSDEPHLKEVVQHQQYMSG